MKEKEEEKVKKPGKGLRHYGKRTVRKIRGKRTNVFIFLDKFEICQDLIGGKIMEKQENGLSKYWTNTDHRIQKFEKFAKTQITAVKEK